MIQERRASARLGYRPDIDGLRAVAVLLVLFNHVGLPWFSGGFVGVDIFFVISGYLISAVILKEIAAGRFSVAQFYERRVRRILPALFVMMLVTSGVAYWFLYPSELKAFARTELGALFSYSNVVLEQKAGYFDPDSRFQPLLHTWSLGVEEQFYIFFPLLLLAICRWFRRALVPVLWVLAVLGLALGVVWQQHDSSAAFYFALSRAWEFLLGSLLAARAMPVLRSAWKRNVASGVGLLLILRAGVHFTSTTPFPGWRALVPCVGAMLIIASGIAGTSTVGSLLAWKPIRLVGLISYSLYLWHWPIQVFQRIENILVPERYPNWVAQVAVIAASFGVAALSWRFIEQPFRTSRLRNRKPLFTFVGALAALLLVFSASFLYRDGMPLPGLPKTLAQTYFMAAMPDQDQSLWGICYMDPQDVKAKLAPVCAADSTLRNVLLLGDSHAAHLYWGLKTVFPEVGFSEIAVTGCSPRVPVHDGTDDRCARSDQFIFDEYLPRHKIDTVVLSGRWSQWNIPDIPGAIAAFRRRGINVVVVGPSIEFDAPLTRLLQLADRERDPGLVLRHRSPEPQQLDRRMQTLAREEWHVPYISMYEDLCQAQVLAGVDTAGCPLYAEPGVALLSDGDHLSPSGSILLAKAIRRHDQLP